MTLQFEFRREDILAFTQAYNAESPTYLKARSRTRWALPLLLVVIGVIQSLESGFQMSRAVCYTAVSIAWFVFYPKRFDSRAQKYAEKASAEPGYSKTLGPCTLTLSDEGLHSISAIGTSTFKWDAVSRATLTADYLYIFLSGPLGYPIRIADIGRDVAEQALALVNQHMEPKPQ
ncbi:MAG: YcxB family protein [Prosthecobacter sp.]|uniref:YcxB family protein n=1 Tax=Prosthecobacter sp. TaxID=1965333 RepID=UPI0025E36AA5|nr:YcxB family protein [Prosthecobacter sp.]MCF7785173.1 YcxB family protein [Prosthecobacter sp.]